MPSDTTFLHMFIYYVFLLQISGCFGRNEVYLKTKKLLGLKINATIKFYG